MKTAVIITGQMRTFARCLPNLKFFVFDLFKSWIAEHPEAPRLQFHQRFGSVNADGGSRCRRSAPSPFNPWLHCAAPRRAHARLYTRTHVACFVCAMLQCCMLHTLTHTRQR